MGGRGVTTRVLINGSGKQEEENQRDDSSVRRTRRNISDFEDGRKGPQAKECGWPPEGGKRKNMDSFLEFPEGMQPC